MPIKRLEVEEPVLVALRSFSADRTFVVAGSRSTASNIFGRPAIIAEEAEGYLAPRLGTSGGAARAKTIGTLSHLRGSMRGEIALTYGDTVFGC